MPAFRVIRRFRDLLDVNWGTFADEDVPQYDVATGKFVGVPMSGGGGEDVPFVGDDPPADPEDGELWWDTDDDTEATGSELTGMLQGLAASPVDGTLVSGGFHNMVWGEQDNWNPEHKGQIEDILDFTDPTIPTVKLDGIYTFDVEINFEGSNDGTKKFNGTFFADYEGFGDGPREVMGLAGTGTRAISVSLTRYLTAGMGVAITVNQNSGATMANVWQWTHVVVIPVTVI